jgi:arylsulfatase
MDRIARRGALFADAVSTTSWTLPSHMSVLTGQYPESHGVWDDDRSLPAEKETLAEMLRVRGYATAGFWSGPYLHPAYGFDQGFDTYEACVNYRIQLNDEGHITNTGHANMYSRSGVTDPLTGAKVDAWLADAPTDRPYFLFVHYWDPHADYEAPAPYDRFVDDGYQGRISGHGIMRNQHIHAGMPEADRRHLMNLYRGEIRWTDWWIGRIVRRLEERGELDRTLLIVVADHGEEFFEHGNHGHRLNLHGETLRVPLLVRYPPAFAAGVVAGGPASLVDVFPTVAAALGQPAGEERQGMDLARVAAGAPPGRVVFAELQGGEMAVRSPRWKAIVDRRTGDGTLYSLAADPAETRDVRSERADVWRTLITARQRADPARFAPEGTEPPVLDPETEAELRTLGYTE